MSAIDDQRGMPSPMPVGGPLAVGDMVEDHGLILRVAGWHEYPGSWFGFTADGRRATLSDSERKPGFFGWRKITPEEADEIRARRWDAVRSDLAAALEAIGVPMPVDRAGALAALPGLRETARAYCRAIDILEDL